MAEMMMDEVRKNSMVPVKEDVSLGFGSSNAFTEIQRVGTMFSKSDMVPKEYKGNVGNCTIAVEIALRMKISPLMVMHNLFAINGRPAWSTPYLISSFNACGRYSSLRYNMVSQDGKPCAPGESAYGCYCSAVEKATGKELMGTLVTMDIARMEGWLSKGGSKWKTMPEQMLRYRAASWFIRAYAPEVSMGLYSEEEVEDFTEPQNKEKVLVINEKKEVVIEQPQTIEAELEEDDVKVNGLRKQLLEAIVEVAGADEEKQAELFRRANGGSDKHTIDEIPKLPLTAVQYLLTRVRQIADGE